MHIAKRGRRYTSLVARIQRFIVAILREDQHYREDHQAIAQASLAITNTE